MLDLSTRKIISVAAERLGDTLLLTPAYRALRAAFPTLIHDVVTVSEVSRQALQHNTAVSRLIHTTDICLPNVARCYDLALNLHDGPFAQHFFSALCCPVVDFTRSPHIYHQAEQLVTTMYCLSAKIKQANYRCELPVSHTDQQTLVQLLAEHGLRNARQPLIGFHVGCHGLAKKRWFRQKQHHPKVWPIEKFTACIGRLLTVQPNCHIVLTGASTEQTLAERILDQHPSCINLMGKTSVRQLRALMPYLSCFVTSDTGACHVAAASEVAIVALYRHASILRTGPYPAKDYHHVLSRDKVSEISVKEVCAAIQACLQQPSQSREGIV